MSNIAVHVWKNKDLKESQSVYLIRLFETKMSIISSQQKSVDSLLLKKKT